MASKFEQFRSIYIINIFNKHLPFLPALVQFTIQLIILCYCLHHPKKHLLKFTGEMSSIGIMICFLSIIRNNPISNLLLGVSWERQLNIHKLWAVFGIFLGYIHFSVAIRKHVHFNRRMGFSGLIILFGMTAMALLSIPIIRRRLWNIFYIFHVIMAIVVLYYSFIHKCFYIFYCGGIVWSVDVILRFIFEWITSWFSIEEAIIQELKHTNKLGSSGIIQIDFTYSYSVVLHYILSFFSSNVLRPGAYFMLNIPSISLWEYHPISILSVEEILVGPIASKCPWTRFLSCFNFSNQVKITLVLKSTFSKNKHYLHEPWTERLYKLVSRSKEGCISTSIRLQGPYGNSNVFMDEYLEESHSSVYIASGLGITPVLNAFKLNREVKRNLKEVGGIEISDKNNVNDTLNNDECIIRSSDSINDINCNLHNTNNNDGHHNNNNNNHHNNNNNHHNNNNNNHHNNNNNNHHNKINNNYNTNNDSQHNHFHYVDRFNQICIIYKYCLKNSFNDYSNFSFHFHISDGNVDNVDQLLNLILSDIPNSHVSTDEDLCILLPQRNVYIYISIGRLCIKDIVQNRSIVNNEISILDGEEQSSHKGTIQHLNIFACGTPSLIQTIFDERDICYINYISDVFKSNKNHVLLNVHDEVFEF